MPSIEIVCVDQERPLQVGDLSFAVESGTQLISHRRPSRFQKDFDGLTGCIYHLGNPALKKKDAPGAFFAWDLLSPECQDQERELFLQFAAGYATDVRRLLEQLLHASPAKRVIFTSDHQFGPEVPTRFSTTTLEAFWGLHDARTLGMNALYPLVG